MNEHSIDGEATVKCDERKDTLEPLVEMTERCISEDDAFVISNQNQDLQILQLALIDIFESKTTNLKPNALVQLHRAVRKILSSKTGPLLFDYFKSGILPKGMKVLRQQYKREMRRGGDEAKPLEIITKIWTHFFRETLPLLDSILFLLKCRSDLTIRTASFISFRDEFLLHPKIDFEKHVKELFKKEWPRGFTQMVLLIQGIMDTFPPSKSKLRMETITASVVSPFMGYKGVYENYDNRLPVVTSSEPELNAVHRQQDMRRISRPLSVQPKQMETLNELFMSALRKRVA